MKSSKQTKPTLD